MAKAPIPSENKKGQVATQDVTKNLDYTTIADRLRTVRWTNYCQPTDFVKQV